MLVKMGDSQERAFTPCADFDLAPLRSFSKEVFRPDSPTDAFVLVLSVAFNDLKGMMWMIEQLNRCRPVQFALEPYTGQWQGMHVQAKRYIAGIINELLVAIVAANDAGILQDAALTTAIRKSGTESSTAWDDLVAVATNQHLTTDVRRSLRVARNRAAFHYDRARLWDSYKKYFVTGPQTQYTAAAFVSLGPKMEQTRFFYADAAADKALGFSEPIFAEINRHIRGMNQALRNIVEQYLLQREADLAS
jgi:hypothetical protein